MNWPSLATGPSYPEGPCTSALVLLPYRSYWPGALGGYHFRCRPTQQFYRTFHNSVITLYPGVMLNWYKRRPASFHLHLHHISSSRQFHHYLLKAFRPLSLLFFLMTIRYKKAEISLRDNQPSHKELPVPGEGAAQLQVNENNKVCFCFTILARHV